MFVELGYLREYRRKGVPLQRLRPVIDELRREFDTPYPLATAKLRGLVLTGTTSQSTSDSLAMAAMIGAVVFFTVGSGSNCTPTA